MERDKPQLRQYMKGARPLADAIKARLLSIRGSISMARTTKGGDLGDLQLIILLNALMQRVPVFDKVPRYSLSQGFELAQIFLGIFQYPKGGMKQ